MTWQIPLCRAGSTAAAWVVVGTLAGCMTAGPDFQRPVPQAPARMSEWHGGSPALAAPESGVGAPVAADRWSAFNDPVLKHLQVLALQANQDLQTATLRFVQARVAETTVAAQHGLQVAARGAVARQRQSEVGASTRLIDALGQGNQGNREALIGALSAPFTLYQAGFDASWELDLWGRVRRSVESAQASTEGAGTSLRQAQLSITAELSRTYFQLRSVQRQWRLAQQELAATEEIESLLRAQFQGGLTDQSASIRQAGQSADLRARLPALLELEARAINRITLLCGLLPGALQSELTPMESGIDDPALPDLALGLPSEFARRRPDIAAAQARLHAATANIGIAMAELYPQITLGASFGSESVGAARFGQWASRQWSIGPSLSLPVFDQGRRKATVTLRELQQQEAAVAYQQTVLQAWHEVDEAITRYVAEGQRRDKLQEKVRRGAEALALAKTRYAKGLTDALPQLDAERSHLQAQRELAESTGLLSTGLVGVYKALGDDGTLHLSNGAIPARFGATR